MPWLETGPLEQKRKFIEAWQANQEPFIALCDRFGVSRKSGYKWLARYEARGLSGLVEGSRVAHHLPHKTSAEVEDALVALKREKPHWGPKKLLVLLARRRPGVGVPAPSTASAILKKHGLVKACPQRSRRELRRVTLLVEAEAPNDCWSADHKGDFALGDGTQCYPLTVTDNYSRYLLRCTALAGIHHAPAQVVLESAFKEYGLPHRIRTDNGAPFGSTRGLALSKLSLWWMRLGIRHERITAGVPQQNGRHERMHRTLKAEATIPRSPATEHQQRRFEAFLSEYNDDRPHEALGMQTPRSLYVSSPRQLPQHLPPLGYPEDFERRAVGANGRFAFEGQKYFVTKVLHGEDVGLELVDGTPHRVWAGTLPLGILNRQKRRIDLYDEDEQLELSGVSPMLPV
jgi:transposase InsO family protein